jgi:prepilin-type N-terminal cleavage/methylation domain-containing protein
MKKGFTIIEMLVVGAIGVVLITVVFYILSSSSKMASKSRLNRIIDDQSAFLIDELKKNVMWATPGSLTCPSNTVNFKSRVDDGSTIIRLSGTRVASDSANIVFLTSDEVVVTNFTVSCVSTKAYPDVNIGFTMRAGAVGAKPEDVTSKSFNTTVTVRP